MVVIGSDSNSEREIVVIIKNPLLISINIYYIYIFICLYSYIHLHVICANKAMSTGPAHSLYLRWPLALDLCASAVQKTLRPRLVTFNALVSALRGGMVVKRGHVSENDGLMVV
jgi:hypothetical protein